MGISRRAALKGICRRRRGRGRGAAGEGRCCSQCRRLMPSASFTMRRSASAARRAWLPAAMRTGCRRTRPAVPRRSTTRQWTFPRKRETVIKLYRDDEPRYVKTQCMHCLDAACTNACMLGALKKREFGIVTYDADAVRRMPLLRSRLPVQRAEIPMELDGASDRQVRAVPRATRGRQRAGLHGGVPSEGGHFRQARRPAQRGASQIASRARTNTCRRCTARPTAAAPRCCTSRTCRSKSSACPLSARSRPADLARSIQHGVYRGFVAPGGAVRGAGRGDVP